MTQKTLFTSGSVSEGHPDKLADQISEIKKNFDLRPAKIIADLNLARPIYTKTAAYGHFGRNEPEFTWEKIRNANI